MNTKAPGVERLGENKSKHTFVVVALINSIQKRQQIQCKSGIIQKSTIDDKLIQVDKPT